MLRKTSDDPVDYVSDSPAQDYARFEDAMYSILRSPSATSTNPPPNVIPGIGDAATMALPDVQTPAGVRDIMLLMEQIQPVSDMTVQFSDLVGDWPTEIRSSASSDFVR